MAAAAAILKEHITRESLLLFSPFIFHNTSGRERKKKKRRLYGRQAVTSKARIARRHNTNLLPSFQATNPSKKLLVYSVLYKKERITYDLPSLSLSPIHWDICGNCSIFRHFLLFPLLLSPPPVKKETKIKWNCEEKLKIKGVCGH